MGPKDSEKSLFIAFWKVLELTILSCSRDTTFNELVTFSSQRGLAFQTFSDFYQKM